MRLLQIVPRLPPPIDGVGDYALALTRALAAAGVATTFLVPGPEPREPDAAFALRALPLRNAEALAGALDAWSAEGKGKAAVLVHYVGYAYQRRGCPAWLVDGLASWRSRGAQPRLVGLFHEVYANGPPWRSSFWLSPRQRRLAATLARACDRVVTSIELYRGRLAPWVPAEEVAVLPVLSTVGELAAPPPLAARRRRLVVFGGAGTRARAYGPRGAALAAACAALRISEIADVGPGTDVAPAVLAGVPTTRWGELPAAAIGSLLADSLAGFVAHTPAFLGKSTVFAAYCAHGVLPVAASRERDEARTWSPGDDAGDASLQRTADAAAAWYADHSLARQAVIFRRLLGAEGA